MTVWEQEQNRTQNWLTPSAKIWPRLNHHLESDVFPLSFPELQIWMKQHKRGPSLKTWEPSQIFTVPIFQPLPLKELNAETCRNMPKPDLLELKDARKRYEHGLKMLETLSVEFFCFFPAFPTSQDSTSAMRLPVRQIASKAHLGARYQRSRGFRSLGSDTMWHAGYRGLFTCERSTCPSCLSKNSSNITKHPGFGLTPQIDKIAFQPGPKWVVTCGDS